MSPWFLIVVYSDDNAQMIEDAQMKYISALDRNQIPGCGVDLAPFKEISIDDEAPKPAGYKKYDDQLYFNDHGIVGNKRFIIGFNRLYSPRTAKIVKRKSVFSNPI